MNDAGGGGPRYPHKPVYLKDEEWEDWCRKHRVDPNDPNAAKGGGGGGGGGKASDPYPDDPGQGSPDPLPGDPGPEPSPGPGERQMLPPPSAPMLVARKFVDARCCSNGILTLRYWCGSWFLWKTTHWEDTPPHSIKSMLYAFTAGARYRDKNKEIVAWSPNRGKIADLLEALSTQVELPPNLDFPCWLDGRETGPIVAVTNGLLDVTSRELLEQTPLYFSQVSVPFQYDPDAPEPAQWLEFLKALWPDDQSAIAALQEWYGYVASGRLDLQKIFATIGPRRGGKGIIARILTALIGRRNVCGPTLNSLARDFGLQSLLGKSLAIISDARSAGRGGSVSSTTIERLLTISGQDLIDVGRKYREDFTGTLPVRLHILSNELPRLSDASGAIISRLVVVTTTRSWLGKEDHSLEKKLRAELPSILNWALEGLRRLTIDNKNQFTHVASSDDAIRQLDDLASPVGAFVRERCKLDPDEEVATDTLYNQYKYWCEENGQPTPDNAHFGRDLKAACPSIRKQRPRKSGTSQLGKAKRLHVYAGVRLRAEDDEEEELL